MRPCLAAKAIAVLILLAGGTTAMTGPAVAEASLQQRVRVLEDRAEIHDLLLDYGRTLDARDFAGYSQLFATDGEWTGGGPFGALKGPAAIRASMEANFKAAPGSFHLLTNEIIRVRGDHADALSKWDFVSPVDGRPVIVAAGHYEDALVREHGRWKFQRRLVVTTFAPPSAPAPK